MWDVLRSFKIYQIFKLEEEDWKCFKVKEKGI